MSTTKVPHTYKAPSKQSIANTRAQGGAAPASTPGSSGTRTAFLVMMALLGLALLGLLAVPFML